MIEKMASNSQQFSGRNDVIVFRGQSGVNEHPKAYTANKYSNLSQQQKPDA
ncbi:hypothetical protein Fmac_008358 [Flemingia macrophylla]|uniref:Uncharacterized protein n=1 Tax=Flemingia macrophylla TaxID=520843 RepID=A0ABD1MX64_9FABA